VGFIDTGRGIWNGDRDVEVSCQFDGGFEAHFAGTEPGLEDFYRILQTAIAKKGNS